MRQDETYRVIRTECNLLTPLEEHENQTMFELDHHVLFYSACRIRESSGILRDLAQLHLLCWHCGLKTLENQDLGQRTQLFFVIGTRVRHSSILEDPKSDHRKLSRSHESIKQRWCRFSHPAVPFCSPTCRFHDGGNWIVPPHETRLRLGRNGSRHQDGCGSQRPRAFAIDGLEYTSLQRRSCFDSVVDWTKHGGLAKGPGCNMKHSGSTRSVQYHTAPTPWMCHAQRPTFVRSI